MILLKKVLISFLVIVFLLSIIGLKLLKINYVSKLQFDQQSIVVKRTDNNIPEIYAPSFRSAMYAWGYVTAEDRLFQLAFRRQIVKGRLSQLFGQKSIQIDKMFRQIDLHGWAQKSSERFLRENQSEYRNFQAYAKGINDYYDSLTFNPFEFHMVGLKWQNWTVVDTFCFFKLLKWSLSFGMMDQYIRSSLLNNYTKQQVDKFFPYKPEHWLKGNHANQSTIVKDDQIPLSILQRIKNINFHTFDPIPVKQMFEIGFYQYLDLNQRASNSWVISSNHTQSGHALLCNDPHLDSALPAEYHQVKIFYPNIRGQQVYIIGAGLVGTPTFLGKTSYVSSTMTTNYMDSQDLFRQKIEGQKYWFDNQWRPLKLRKQIIKVKGSQPLQYTIYETHRGPMIKHIAYKGFLYKVQQPISLCWIGYSDAQYISLVPYSHMAQIQNFEELQVFLSERTDYGPPFNFLYSTLDDHIGYQAVGMVPLRRTPHSGMYVKDGTTSKNDWIGSIQGKNKLHLIDPARGFIVSANNKAASSKYYNGVFDISIYTARADRIQSLINKQIAAGRKMNKQYMKKIQQDTVDVYCLQVVQKMKQKIATGEVTYKFVYSVFDKFGCNFATQSTTSPFWITFLQNVYEQIHPEGKGNATFALSNQLSYFQYIYSFLLSSHTHQQLVKLNNSMFDATRQLRQYFNSENILAYKYGQLHRDHMIHRPFSNVQLIKKWFENDAPGWGNMNTVNVAVMNKFHEKDYRTNHRANLRLIMSYYEDSQWIIDGGASQKFYSPYYRDQLKLFFQGKYLTMDKWNRTAQVF